MQDQKTSRYIFVVSKEVFEKRTERKSGIFLALKKREAALVEAEKNSQKR
jgi:hypothetical protein